MKKVLVFVVFLVMVGFVGWFYYFRGVDYTPGQVSTQLQADDRGVIYYTSSDAYDLDEFRVAPPVTVDGALTIPHNYNGKTLIFSHGSGGVYGKHEYWRDFLSKKGFAVFMLRHFTPRGVADETRGQFRVTEPQMAFDALYAAKLLRTHPKLKQGKIYHIGWSKGAIAGLLTSMEPVQNLIFKDTADKPFDGFIEFYPWCGMTGQVKIAAPMLIIMGDADDYTPPKLCDRFIGGIDSAGAQVSITKLAGAHHSFDDWNHPKKGKITHLPGAITIRDMSDACTLVLNPETMALTSVDGTYTGKGMFERIKFLYKCSERGTHLGTAPQHKERTEKLVLDFLANH